MNKLLENSVGRLTLIAGYVFNTRQVYSKLHISVILSLLVYESSLSRFNSVDLSNLTNNKITKLHYEKHNCLIM